MSNPSILIALMVFMVVATTTSATEMSAVIGDWKLAQIYDSPTGTDPLGLPTTGGPFIFHFMGKEDSTDTLSFHTKIGNTMRGNVQFTAGSTDGIQFGPILSSRMMPEASQYRLEMYLSQYLPKMTTLTVSDDGQKLILSGEGKIVCDVFATTEI